MKYYWIDVYVRNSESYGPLKALHWKAESIKNLRKRLVTEHKNGGLTFVVFEVPSDKGLVGALRFVNDKGYKGTYYIRKVDGKNVPTWSVDQGNGWDYIRHAIKKDGTLGRRL